jgi:hypothetical protein
LVVRVTSPLENLAGPGKSLRAEPFEAKEYAGLVHSAQVRLADAQKEALDALPPLGRAGD